MGYWKCSIDIFMSPVMQRIVKQINRYDHMMGCRESIFIKLLTFSADGHLFSDASHLSRITTSPSKPCQEVWDVCIELKVLRQTKNGFSAIRWMKEAGLLPAASKAAKSPTFDEDTTPPNHTTEAETSEPVQTSAQETASEPEPAEPTQPIQEQPPQEEEQETENASPENNSVQNEIKECVRPNVFLSRSELSELKGKFNDEQITTMLDKLSEYKSQTKRNYGSDYQAIQRWVIRWLSTTQQKSQQAKFNPTPESGVFPTWLTGK